MTTNSGQSIEDGVTFRMIPDITINYDDGSGILDALDFDSSSVIHNYYYDNL